MYNYDILFKYFPALFKTINGDNFCCRSLKSEDNESLSDYDGEEEQPVTRFSFSAICGFLVICNTISQWSFFHTDLQPL